MMQTEPNFRTSAGPAPQNPQAVPAIEMTRTRCPGCQKLFAVETETLNAMARAGVIRAEFTCTGELCRESFAIQLPLPENYSSLTIVPAMRLDAAPDVHLTNNERAAEEALAKYEMPPSEQAKQQTQAVLKAPLLGSKLAALGGERECPRCGSMNAVTMNECARCGIVFDRYAGADDEQLEEELALGGTRELAQMWERTLEDYEDRIRHDRFLNACRDAGALSYASKKYSQILVAAPQDDIARLMRNRIVAMISMRAESSRLPIRLSFRIPKLNSMALFGGSVLFFWGLMMPQLKNVMEIGLSLVLLSIGVRLALRARIDRL